MVKLPKAEMFTLGGKYQMESSILKSGYFPTEEGARKEYRKIVKIYKQMTR